MNVTLEYAITEENALTKLEPTSAVVDLDLLGSVVKEMSMSASQTLAGASAPKNVSN